MGSRGSDFDDSDVKKNVAMVDVNSMIDDAFLSPTTTHAVMQYLDAIEKRDKNAVMALDDKLKKGEFGTGKRKDKVSAIRKELLRLAKNDPEEVTKIHELSKKKTETLAFSPKNMTVEEKVDYLKSKFVGKKVRLKNNVDEYYASENKISSYYPAGLEGTVLKAKSSYIPPVEGVHKGIVSYHLLLQFEDGWKKWINTKDLEPIKG